MTDIESNKRVALRFFSLLSAEGIDEAVSLLTDDATWQAVRATDSPLTDGIDKQAWEAMMRAVLGELKSAITFDIRTVTAEGDRVALEAVGNSRLPDDTLYTNYYVMVVELRDGKICAVREYQDTLAADSARSGLASES